MIRRKTLWISLSLLGLVLLGTVVVLSSISFYLSIDTAAYLTEDEVGVPYNGSRWNATAHGKTERIPRILHQTWRSQTLPDKWKDISQECRDMMPDYEYILWTDASSREFIAEYYPWFLDTFDNYEYPIQRADAIRYFVLYHYGGVYLDLDVGCLQRLDPLLVYPVILPKTIPVGVSNDLMFAEKEHPFMRQTIDNLISWNHDWVINYPTVMFSTGPMFLSGQYALYAATHAPTPDQPGGEVRILPKSLYGKNAKPEEAPHAFFAHYYGSSWHAGDAGFIGFLGKWGKTLMWIGSVLLIIGLMRLAILGDSKRKYSLRRIGRYEIFYPRWQERSGRWYIDLGFLSVPTHSTAPSSPISLPPSPTSSLEEGEVLLPLPISVRPASPSPSEVSLLNEPPSSPTSIQPVVDAVVRTGSRIIAAIVPSSSLSSSHRSPRRPRRRGVIALLPAIFASQDMELNEHQRSPLPPQYRDAPAAPTPGPEKRRYEEDFESAGLTASALSSRVPSRVPSPPSMAGSSSAPPPYDRLEDGTYRRT
ncbi:hypothetical protein GLOTRDRAFT_109709 [Gloeophyllum trabeum ATCC 11539]|uniref:Glycosyltransferase family 32 protein n=1 Tax=Gloeophyllum trabeum (strain ATCC 11539 / FP-39264 / Madison 617) TaxID=670483 RepID=S7QJK6_GLOTA|nr:uncharacterized protein GLOTRDRAFT_109709 [Gloeophyllum trabeum ATCC 11539]EPQ59478.1 hypothetical protein GLOTRDRAFT_109709 [Gloeophyllum trabeum ATCC 11539]